jgi:hypothetical protein
METVRIIYEIILGLLVLYLAFFKSYFKEKGNNLATLEDIGKITKIVEQTKQEFDLQTETIKQQIQFLNQKKISLVQEEKDAIICSYKAYCKLLNQLMSVSSSFISDLGLEEIYRINKIIDTIQLEYDDASARLELFYISKELNEKSQKLNLGTIKLKTRVKLFLVKLDLVLKKRQIVEKQSESQGRQEKILQLIDEERELSLEFINERTQLYEPIYQDLMDLRSTLYERIVKILNE